MADGGGISPKIVFGLIGVGLVAFLAAVIVTLGPDRTLGFRDRYGPGMMSKSVIGYAGLAAYLRDRGHTVIRRRYDPTGPAGAPARQIRILTEPSVGVSKARQAHLRKQLERSVTVLVLPKRTMGRAAPRGWLASVGPVSRSRILSTLKILEPDASVTTSRAAIKDNDGRTVIRQDDTERQLVVSQRIKPVLSNESGTLVGLLEDKRRRVWIVSDPDILNNRSFADPEHIAVIDRFLNSVDRDAVFVFDETRAGAAQAPRNFLAVLLQAPLYYILIYGVLVLILALWAAAPRFGPVFRAQSELLVTGRAELIAAAAGLLRLAGQDGEIIRRYLGASIRDAMRRNHAPENLEGDALITWLDRVGAARSVTEENELARISARVGNMSAARQRIELKREAARIFDWKKRMIHGS